MKLKQWLREPLVHFLCAGAAIFMLASWWEGPDESGRTIHIGRDDLLVFMQGRAQVYDDDTFNALLNEMSEEDRQALIRDTALQEALYREGKALNLAEADPLVRQRMVQQMRLILAEEAASDMQVSDADVQEFFRQNTAQYAVPAAATFTHVFVRDPKGKGKAQSILSELRGQKVPASGAAEYGDRFLYQLNYSEADKDLVSSHFGQEFASTVFSLKPGSWQGPFRSEHGWHLVMPLQVRQQRVPEFAEVAARVRDDTIADRRRTAANGALDSLLDRFKIRLEDDL